MHIPDDPLYYEKYYFAPGDLGFQAVDTAYGRVGTLVCWDQWYPEAARLTALKGAETIFYPTAIGWHPAEKAEFGERNMRHGRPFSAPTPSPTESMSPASIASGLSMAKSGQSRAGPGIEFWGGSFLADPFGRIIAKASHDAEEILIGEIDLGSLKRRAATGPFCATAASTPMRRSPSDFSIR